VNGWEQGTVGVFRSQRFDVAIELPDGKHWAIRDRKSSWLLATHAPSASSLRLQLYRGSKPFNRERCENYLRQQNPDLPTEAVTRVVDDQSRDVLPGWDARSVILFRQAPGPVSTLEASMLIFAADVRRCFGFVYQTRQSGEGAEAIVGARMGDVREKIVRTLRFEHDLNGPSRQSLP